MYTDSRQFLVTLNKYSVSIKVSFVILSVFTEKRTHYFSKSQCVQTFVPQGRNCFSYLNNFHFDKIVRVEERLTRITQTLVYIFKVMKKLIKEEI